MGTSGHKCAICNGNDIIRGRAVYFLRQYPCADQLDALRGLLVTDLKEGPDPWPPREAKQFVVYGSGRVSSKAYLSLLWCDLRSCGREVFTLLLAGLHSDITLEDGWQEGHELVTPDLKHFLEQLWCLRIPVHWILNLRRHGTRVHLRHSPKDGNPDFDISCFKGSLERRRPPPKRQKGRVNIECAQPWSVQEAFREELAVGCCDTEVRFQGLKFGKKLIIFDHFLRRQNGYPAFLREACHRRWRHFSFLAPALESCGLGHNCADFPVCICCTGSFDKDIERAPRNLRGAQENDLLLRTHHR
mmetsp:Transcript_35680/g.48187  ORF Transcript_35680/g.48187 Transcript_35680/m.48187 type:complete len:302 (+) Transcript_35680:355-1260(+)